MHALWTRDLGPVQLSLCGERGEAQASCTHAGVLQSLCRAIALALEGEVANLGLWTRDLGPVQRFELFTCLQTSLAGQSSA